MPREKFPTNSLRRAIKPWLVLERLGITLGLVLAALSLVKHRERRTRVDSRTAPTKKGAFD